MSLTNPKRISGERVIRARVMRLCGDVQIAIDQLRDDLRDDPEGIDYVDLENDLKTALNYLYGGPVGLRS